MVTREPKRREHLAELEPDRAAAHHEQRLGQLRQLERRDVVEPLGPVDSLTGETPVRDPVAIRIRSA
jgi:hypothetical protein